MGFLASVGPTSPQTWLDSEALCPQFPQLSHQGAGPGSVFQRTTFSALRPGASGVPGGGERQSLFQCLFNYI